jgi:hypothetical protein
MAGDLLGEIDRQATQARAHAAVELARVDVGRELGLDEPGSTRTLGAIRCGIRPRTGWPVWSR